MKKKLITLLLASSMVVTALAGCGQKTEESKTSEDSVAQESSSKEADQQSEIAEETSNFNEEGYPIVNEEITLKILVGTNDNFNPVNPSEMATIKELEELTGIKTEWELVKASDWTTKLNLILASEEYPDVIMSNFTPMDYEAYGVDQKILIPLDDLIDKYMPNYTERIAMEDVDPTMQLAASDGQTYTIGYMNNSAELMVTQYFINGAWLDKLDLDMPTNLEQLTDVLRAFKEKDPNGNGKADEIALLGGMNNVGQYHLGFYLQFFGVPYNMNNWMFIDDNKEVQFTPWQDGFRECMEWLHTCYEEGLLDQEAFSHDMTTIQSKLKAGVGFTTFYIPRSDCVAEGCWEDYELYIPDENTRLSWIISSAKPGTYITALNEYPEATARFLDAMLEKETMYNLYYGRKDGKDCNNYWEYNDEGLIVQCQKPEEEWDNSLKAHTLSTYGMFFAPGEYFKQSFVPSVNWGYKVEYDEAYKETGLMTKYSYTPLDWVDFTVEQNEKINLMKTEIKTAVDEWMTKFIKDGVTDASWDEFVKILKNVKAEEYIAMYQAGIDGMELE